MKPYYLDWIDKMMKQNEDLHAEEKKEDDEDAIWRSDNHNDDNLTVDILHLDS